MIINSFVPQSTDVKSLVYVGKPATLEHLEADMKQDVGEIPFQMLDRVVKKEKLL